MNSLLSISGPKPEAFKATVAAIVQVIKAGGTEAVAVAGLNALVALCKSPENVAITNCSFIGDTAKKKKRSKR